MLAGTTIPHTQPDGRVRLAPDTIHLFTVDLDRVEPAGSGYNDLLLAEIRSHVADGGSQFRSRRALMARICLRRILGRCSGRDPRSLTLGRDAGGKPRLLERGDPEQINFNVSHSGDLMLVAILVNAPIGVDIEALRTIDNMLSIAGYYFSDAELQELLSVSPQDRCRAFYAGWTRKEAFVKATGEGMGRDFRSFDVTLSPAAVPQIKAIRSATSTEDPHAWQVFAFEPCPDYVAAVVTRGEGWRLARVD